jgi:uncharacterized protein DUF2703
MATPTRRLHIDFLYLDLDTCSRCRATDTALLQALELAHPVLEATAIAVAVNKTLVGDEGQAREQGFVSSPTIRINGIDIAGELVESACDTCAEACACDGEIDCRDWLWQGERSTEPPVGLIVEAIMGHAFGAVPGGAPAPSPGTTEVPENLSRFFASEAANRASPGALHCCEPAERTDCCEAAAEETCCGPAATTSGECGCH